MNKKRKNLLKHLLIHFILIIACFMCIFPILWIFSASVNASNQLVSISQKLLPTSITWDHYRSILLDSPFGKWVLNSFFIAGSTTIVCLVLSATCAYAYSRFKFLGRKTGLWLFLLLNAFPNVLSVVAYFKILSALNLLNNRFGLIIIYVGSQLAFTIWNLKGYFDTIPIEIEESAIIDGANKYKIFQKVILPLSKPALAVTAMLGFMMGWNEYVLAMTFLMSKEKFSLSVGIWTLQEANSYSMNWPLFAAGSLIVALPVAIMFLLLQKYFVSGLTIGGVKG